MRSPAEQSRADFTSLNSTVNTFLGGKQKAWMTPDQQSPLSYGTNSPTRQRHFHTNRPAPRGYDPPLCASTGHCVNTEPAHQHSLQWHSTQSTLDQGPSNSTSPVLANMINLRKESSDQPASASNGLADTILPSPAASDDIHPDLSHTTVDLDTEQEDPEARRLIDLAARCGGIDELERRLFSAHRFEGLPLGEPTHKRDPNSAVVPEIEAFRAPRQEAPRKRSLGLPRLQSKRARIQAQNGQPLRLAESSEGDMLRRGDSITYEVRTPLNPSLKHYLPILDNYVTRVKSNPSYKRSIEPLRIRLLKDACNVEDCFYLVLHQLYCLYSVEPQTLMQLPGFTQENIQAFNTLAELLGRNNWLPDNATIWFSAFPGQAPYLLQFSTLYQSAYNNVTNFLSKLLGYWHILLARCKQRMSPPLVDELVYGLYLESSVVQHVAFTAVLRSLWGVDQTHFYQKANDVFRQDQIDSMRRRYRMSTANPSTSAEIDSANERLAGIYQMLHAQHLREVQNRSSNPQTTQMPTNEQAPARIPTQQASLPSLHESSLVSPIAAGIGSQVRSEVRRTHSVASLPALNSQLPPYSLIVANDRTHPPYPPPILTPSYGVTAPAVLTSPTTPRARAAQTPLGPATPPQIHQEQLARLDRNIPPPASVVEGSIPLSYPPGYPPRCEPLQGGLETLPPGALGSQRPVNQHDQATSGYRSPFTQHSVSRTALLGDQPLILPLNQVPRFSSRPNPTLSAMHQAHLRSPTLKAVDVHGSRDINIKKYQYIANLTLTPQTIIDGSRNLAWSFHVSEHDFDRIPLDTPSPYGAPSTREVHPGSQMYRIRCAKLPSSEAHPNESDWAVAESVWPNYLFLEINGVRLGLRRKQHHGKDLPINITAHVRKGRNEVLVGLIGPSKQLDGAQYAVAIENIHVIDHKHALDMAVRVPAHETLNLIKTSLTSKPGDDDDLAFVDNTITINLIDPFSARIFDVPVRSLACRHRECFDHENYLQTRKSKHAGWPCMVDEWRCPICDADARPQNLILDCFLTDVREQLARQNRLNTKAIVIDEVGTWRPKPEIRGEVRSGESRVDSTQASSAAAASGGGVLWSPRKRESLVIELDDD